MEARNTVFQRLKPACVSLSQDLLSALKSDGRMHTVTGSLERLHFDLCEISSETDCLDEKLAEYIFFPLSQVLRASQRVPIRCLELTLQCLAILIKDGWKSNVQPQLTAQLVILCSLMAEKQPKGLAVTESTDELRLRSYSCLNNLFAALDRSSGSSQLLVTDENFPQLGQTISIILEGIEDGSSVETQIAATKALESLISNVATRDIQAGFMPGVVSKLTKILTPQTKQRRNPRVITGLLNVLRLMIEDTMGDKHNGTVNDTICDLRTPNAPPQSTIIDETWIQKAASQLKPAFMQIVRLKTHTRQDVRDALQHFCLMLLQICQKSLSNCSLMALETIVEISCTDFDGAATSDLSQLVKCDAFCLNLSLRLLNDKIHSLATTMHSSDNLLKEQKLKEISLMYNVARESGARMDILEKSLAQMLRDSIMITLQMPKDRSSQLAEISPIRSLDVFVANSNDKLSHFGKPLARYKVQERIFESIDQLAKLVVATSQTTVFSASLVRSLQMSKGDMQIAAFSLSLTTIQSVLSERGDIDQLLTLSDHNSEHYQDCLDELYAFSLDILNNVSAEISDPILQALALRTLALRAETTGEDFRHELIDSLYPVLHTMATPDERLQHDSVSTLNIISKACGYGSVKDLIVQNVDYLTNTVALKLNTFDVSPQAPQVLLMMVRLAGPSLLPYLEDTIESIFAALQDYHGYPLLVELLFRTLLVVAEEGARSPQLTITYDNAQAISRLHNEQWQPAHITAVVELLKDRATMGQSSGNSQDDSYEPHPKRPWQSPIGVKIDNEKDVHSKEGMTDSDDVEEQLQETEAPPPAPKTFNLLLKISQLTQHFLPAASPSLRVSLLTLIRTTTPAVSRHKDSFLPLINTLWPEIVTRLDDTEPHVVAMTLEIVGMLCTYAGNFMRSRVIKSWPALAELYRSTTKTIIEASPTGQVPHKNYSFAPKGSSTALVSGSAELLRAILRMRTAPADFVDSSSRIVWDALVKALTEIVRHADLPPELFDEVLTMLEPALEEPEVRSALEEENSDAVWLMRMHRGGVDVPPQPNMRGEKVESRVGKFVDISKSPTSV